MKQRKPDDRPSRIVAQPQKDQVSQPRLFNLGYLRPAKVTPQAPKGVSINAIGRDARWVEKTDGKGEGQGINQKQRNNKWSDLKKMRPVYLSLIFGQHEDNPQGMAKNKAG
ncbi:MAG: hypothetical protein ACLQSR_00900 [Limisphaerales bacterium]